MRELTEKETRQVQSVLEAARGRLGDMGIDPVPAASLLTIYFDQEGELFAWSVDFVEEDQPHRTVCGDSMQLDRLLIPAVGSTTIRWRNVAEGRAWAIQHVYLDEGPWGTENGGELFAPTMRRDGSLG